MPFTRREFLKGLGAAVGGLGLSAYGYERLVPYIHQPDNIIPGVSTWYATSCRECPAGCAMVVRNLQSRVVKCEGNPLHPVNAGRLCARGQASLQALYDPDRIKGPMRRLDSGDMENVEWGRALDAVAARLRERPRIAVISDLQVGSLSTLLRRWVNAFGSDRYIQYEPISYDSVKAVYGGVVPSFDLTASDCVISFGADFLETWISPVEFARQFGEMREGAEGRRARFIYVGPRMSATAASCDAQIIVPPGAEREVAQWLTGDGSPDELARKYDVPPDVLRFASEAFTSAQSPLALPGLTADAAEAAGSLNARAGVNPGRPHALTSAAGRSAMAELVDAMDAGEIDMLLILGANPVYSLPAADGFAEALERVETVVSLSSYMDETTELAHWVLPSSTCFESWGDYQPYSDTFNIIQPVMTPLHNTRQAGQILFDLARRADLQPTSVLGAADYYRYLRSRWGRPVSEGDTADTPAPEWEAIVQRGGQWPGAGREPATPSTGYSTVAPLTSLQPEGIAVTASPASDIRPLPAPAAATEESTQDGEIRLYAYPHPYLYDGRGANKRWLQELAEPLTKGVWGSWVEMHRSLAAKLGVSTDDLVRIQAGDRSVTLPAYVWSGSGVAVNTVAIPIGQGHKNYGRYASGTGANIWPLLEAGAVVVKVAAAGGSKWVTRIRGADTQDGRHIAQTVILGERADRGEHRELTLPLPRGYTYDDFYPAHKHQAHRWAMTIDMNKCIGCHACVTACYAENNIATVGAEAIWRAREMYWIRIDRYIDWQSRSAPVLFQPMLCQHCDSAPCEPVCPVYAAVHSDQGINEQVYNRCVGTRYCSNNCPYKVRRFNWSNFQWPEPLNWQLNPDVTVRSRGVMEKCTFCVQRIRQAESTAKRENRAIRDGEVTPACVETCPAGVFTFGDLMDPNSRVSQIVRQDPRAYQVLHELNTKPGVIYLKRVVEEI